MSNRQIDNFYDTYPKYWKDYSRELIKKVGKCQTCGTKGDKKNKLTSSHLDQNPKNIKKENIKVLCRSCHIKYDQPYHVFSMQSNKKTDNSHLTEKVNLRLVSLKLIKKNEINVLEAFAGEGKIWDKVKNLTDKKINILKIDIKNNKKGVYLVGDSNKFMPLFTFENYDIIDLDAYGVPFFHLETIFRREFKGIVHVTFIQSGMGKLPNKMLNRLGYTKEMINKIPTLFNRDGLGKMQQYLSLNGVKKIIGYFIDRKNYFYFKIG